MRLPVPDLYFHKLPQKNIFDRIFILISKEFSSFCENLIYFMQIEWAAYFDEVFAETSVFINNDEKIIVKEPEFLDGLLPILIATPKDIVGK